ncbi:MAG TPA: flavodoxin domain-containing protein [Actinomycetes bacterium]|nr:flavodoxin domain-containing protein [Actinomycetes bacterium]
MRVLVTAASRHGSTAEIASDIANVLRKHGIETDETTPAEVESVSDFDGVVLGSAVYEGHWLEPAKALVTRCADQWEGSRVWLFSSGPIGSPPKPVDADAPKKVIEQVGPIEHRVFAGKLDRDELGLLERTMVRAVHAPEGDFRDWDEVEDWATSIADTLLEGSVVN